MADVAVESGIGTWVVVEGIRLVLDTSIDEIVVEGTLVASILETVEGTDVSEAVVVVVPIVKVLVISDGTGVDLKTSTNRRI